MATDDNNGKPPAIPPARPLPRVTAAPIAPPSAPPARPPSGPLPAVAPAVAPKPAVPQVTASAPKPFAPITTTPGAPPRTSPASVPPAVAPRPVMPVIAPAVPTPITAAPPAPPRPAMPVIAPPTVSAPPRPAMPVIAPPAISAPPRPAMPVIAPPATAPVARPPTMAPAPVRTPGTPGTPVTSPAVALPPSQPIARPPTPPAIVPPAPPVARPPSQNAIAPPPPAVARPVAPAPVAVARPSPLPTSGAVETISEQQGAELHKLAEGLDAVDYFEALGLAQTATPGDIKKAFYRESRTYHPDRFFHLPESQVKSDIGAIYRRITEAYYVLRDDAKRKKYLADVSGAERANKLRYTEATESELKAEARKTQEEEFGTHPKSRPFFKAAMADYEKQNWAGAERGFKMGLTYEPGATRFKEKLVECQKKLDEQRKGGSSFMIK